MSVNENVKTSGNHKKRILTLVPYYEPGYKAGGLITTVRNSIEHLGDEFDFLIVTSDRDLGDSVPYDLPLDQWISGAPKRYYISGKQVWRLIRILRKTKYDIFYANSYFSFRFSIVPFLWFRLTGTVGKTIIVAPRGELSKGALSIKSSKKKVFISFAKLFRIYKHVIWHASSKEEQNDITRVFGPQTIVRLASDFPSTAESSVNYKNKKNGQLNIVFLARITRMKNLHFALSTLKNIQGEVNFDIYGHIEDLVYWDECQKQINALPANVSVHYKGVIKPSEVKKCLAHYELFYLPTLGEGFGHSIFEALQSGCPVLLSDRTPWNDVATSGGGVVLPLERPDDFAHSLQRYVDISAEEYNHVALQALAYSVEYIKNSQLNQTHQALFDSDMRHRCES
jgi:glycosyltransferase involved in cell wall biosynthesis